MEIGDGDGGPGRRFSRENFALIEYNNSCNKIYEKKKNIMKIGDFRVFISASGSRYVSSVRRYYFPPPLPFFRHPSADFRRTINIFFRTICFFLHLGRRRFSNFTYPRDIFHREKTKKKKTIKMLRGHYTRDLATGKRPVFTEKNIKYHSCSKRL